MSDNIDLKSTNFAKHAALEEMESLKQIRATAWDEHTQAYRWLMASLLGVNGAACVAVLASDNLSGQYKVWSGAFWVFGVLFSLSIAVFGQHSVQRSIAPLQELIGYWISVRNDGIRDEGLESQLTEKLRRGAKIGIGSRIAGWVAAGLFLGGAITAGVGLLDHEGIKPGTIKHAQPKNR